MKRIFVFGSNLAGKHGRGAALHARECHEAIYGAGVGLMGVDDHSYAIPTKDRQIQTLDLETIERYVKEFVEEARYAKANYPRFEFFVTRIGCGLAGYTDKEIAPLFEGVTDNCLMPNDWRGILGRDYNYHGVWRCCDQYR